MVCACATLPEAAAAVKNTLMDTRVAAVLLGSVVFGGAMLGCGDGGQTYDDGSDGLNGKRPAPNTTRESDSGESCSDLALRAAESLEALRAEVDVSCSVDADCLADLLPFATCTHANHCGYKPVSVSGLDYLEEEIELLNSGVCAEFAASSCELGPSWFTPCPAAVPKQAWCDAGTCAVRDVPSCEEAFPGAWQAMTDVYAAANRECTDDDECVLFAADGVSCTPGFSSRCEAEMAINVDAIPFFDSALELVEGEHCSGYEPGSCSVAIDPIACPQGRIARCVDAKCIAVDE